MDLYWISWVFYGNLKLIQLKSSSKNMFHRDHVDDLAFFTYKKGTWN